MDLLHFLSPMHKAFPRLLIQQSLSVTFMIQLSQPWPWPPLLSWFHLWQKCIYWNRMWIWYRTSSCFLQIDRKVCSCHYWMCLPAFAVLACCYLRLSTWPAPLVTSRAFSIAEFRYPQASSSFWKIFLFSSTAGYEYFQFFFLHPSELLFQVATCPKICSLFWAYHWSSHLYWILPIHSCSQLWEALQQLQKQRRKQ